MISGRRGMDEGAKRAERVYMVQANLVCVAPAHGNGPLGQQEGGRQ